MKKILLICALLISGTTVVIPTVNATQVPTAVSNSENEMPADAYPLTVYIIVGTDATVAKSAYYSPSKNRIYIKEGKHFMNYNVHNNPFYGQDSAKGRFNYKASEYFFDL